MHLCSVHALSLHLCSNINIYIYVDVYKELRYSETSTYLGFIFFDNIAYALLILKEKKRMDPVSV